jgi:protoporphyrinogen oxidase
MSDRNIRPNDRIAIIGAGPSGLSAAEFLKNLGYNNITIYEKTGRAGGMCYSRSYKNKNGELIPYDMGSVQPTVSTHLFDLIKKYNLTLGRDFYQGKPAKFRVYSMRERKYVLDFYQHILGVPVRKILHILHDAFKLLYYAFRYKRLSQPGFDDFKHTKEASVSYRDWLSHFHFKALGRGLNVMLGILLMGGHRDDNKEMPVLIALTHVIREVFYPKYSRYMIGHYWPVKQGYGALWQRLSQRHKIICNAKIEQIIRSEDKIAIKCGGKFTEYDRMIVACSPKDLLGIMNVDKVEESLFSNILYSPVCTIAFIAKTSQKVTPSYSVIADPFEHKNADAQIVGFTPCGQVDSDHWLYTAIIGASTPKELNEAIARSKKMLQEHFGLTVTEIIDKMYWPKYCSHYNCKTLRKDVYDQFAEKQGNLRTYYTGEILSGNSNGCVIDYSRALINKFTSK